MKGLNHVAVVVAAVVFFAIGAGWYSVFQSAWLAGIGKSLDQLTRETGGSPMQFVIAFAAILVMCYTLAGIIGRATQPSTTTGVRDGAMVAIGIGSAAIALNYAFEARGVSLWLINAGYLLIGLVVAGAIIGGWRRKTV